MTDWTDAHQIAYQEIARRVREWPAGNMDERFRFGTAAIHILPAHGISTRETERLW